MINKALLLASLIAVESGGNNKAWNMEENAVGCLQIRQCALDDVNEYTGSGWTLEQCYNPVIARWVCLQYLERWKALDSYETAARTWNGGPRGRYKRSTVDYWLKVKTELNKRIKRGTF